MLARHTLCLENSLNLLRGIASKPVIENILECHKFILALKCINIIIDGNVPYIVVRKHYFYVLASFKVVTTKTRKVFSNNRFNLA